MNLLHLTVGIPVGLSSQKATKIADRFSANFLSMEEISLVKVITVCKRDMNTLKSYCLLSRQICVQ